MKVHEIVDLKESVEDKGIFKALFISGLPGAGKTTIFHSVMDGAISPRLVNSDKGYEYLLRKTGISSSDANAWKLLGPTTKMITKESLFQYLNSMLPLCVDGTSANPGNIAMRKHILERIGYDTMLLWVDVSLETSIARVSQRERSVSLDFIKRNQAIVDQTKDQLQSLFPQMIVVNNEGQNYNTVAEQISKNISHFFDGPLHNPTGQKIIEKLRQEHQKYLIPSICSQEQLREIVSDWY